LGALNQPGDFLFHETHPLHGIHCQNGNMTAVNRVGRATPHNLLKGIMDPSFLPQASCVNEGHRETADLRVYIDGIPGGARQGIDHDPPLANHRIYQG